MRSVVLLALALAACTQAPKRDPRLATAPLAARLAAADPRAGAALFGQCAACHSIQRGTGDRAGPNLYAVVGRRVGQGSERFGYSAALQSVGGIWTPERLDAWLTNPSRFAPGTNMAFPGLRDGMDRADVIAFLNGNGSNVALPPANAGRH